MQEIVHTDIDIHGYADDHVLKKSFVGSSKIEENDTIRKLEYSIADIKSRMYQNRLKIIIENKIIV